MYFHNKKTTFSVRDVFADVIRMITHRLSKLENRSKKRMHQTRNCQCCSDMVCKEMNASETHLSFTCIGTVYTVMSISNILRYVPATGKLRINILDGYNKKNSSS